MGNEQDLDNKGGSDFFSLSNPLRYLILALYFAVLLFTAFYGFYYVTYFLFILLFLVIASTLTGYSFFKKIHSLPFRQKILLIFVFALILRLIMLAQSQVITVDLERYIKRTEFMLDGKLPYRDFYGGNKPPLYEFTLYLIGLILGPGELQFRAVFSVFDAAIPVALFLICVKSYNEHFALKAALTYSLFPIGIICMGLSGHYDSIVVLLTLLAVLMLQRKKLNLSGLYLGLAFALKIYPAVLLPFFLTTIDGWKKRILYVILFTIPTIIADGILILISPSAFSAYLAEESEWMGVTSIPITIEMMTGVTEVLSINVSWIVLGIFGILILLLLRDWLSEKRESNLIKWFRFMIIILTIHFGFYILFGVLYYDNPLYLAAVAVLIYFIAAFLLLRRYLDKITPETLEDPKKESIFIVSTFAIMLFMLGLPSQAPWYFVWFFPFLLAVKTDRIRYILMWLFPWRGLGENVRLLPGLGKVN